MIDRYLKDYRSPILNSNRGLFQDALMDISRHFYPSNLLPAAPVEHGYKNFWLRDGYYVGICSPEDTRKRLWSGIIGLLDHYKWKLEIHAKKQPIHWFEHIHVRYSPEGREISSEHWLHNQWESIANTIEVTIDENRDDLTELLVDYLNVAQCHKRPAAGAWEDRNSCDAYSLAGCIHAFQRAKTKIGHRYADIDSMVKKGCKRLYSILPHATVKKEICLSELGIIWPFNLAGPYKEEIIGWVCKKLMREPFGFIRYEGDRYDGEGFSRGRGTEMPWLLGDLFMAHIEPHNPIWKERLKRAYEHFGCMPEAYAHENLQANRNTPLLWAEAMWNHLQ